MSLAYQKYSNFSPNSIGFKHDSKDYLEVFRLEMREIKNFIQVLKNPAKFCGV
ncbi:hypothetical protein FACS189418_2210 [Clostridia bacterium]|nr:hypothetical protein FACS189418_2210 [Clostridia bacterium]